MFVRLLTVVLPLGLVGEFTRFGHNYVWFAIPISVLIFWVFYVMQAVGNNSENPFENNAKDIPITAIRHNIEIDLREMLGEKDVPTRIKPVADILM